MDDLVAGIGHHVALEECTVLVPLAEAVPVPRLRVVGEAFRRRRDAVVNSHGGVRDLRPTASRAELYEKARHFEIDGRSSMSREELLTALRDRPR
jgi:hypothetical protein